MVNSLRKVDFSYPAGHYTWKNFRPPPPFEKILGAPLLEYIYVFIYSSRLSPLLCRGFPLFHQPLDDVVPAASDASPAARSGSDM